MAASSEQPGLWAERMLMILPSQDGKPEEIHETPLRECTSRVVEALRRRSSRGHPPFAILLTDASKVGAFVSLLRESTGESAQRRLLIGSTSEHQWLLAVLDVIVATPEEALRMKSRCWIPSSSSALKALLIDLSSSSGCTILDQALQVAGCFPGFESYSHLMRPLPTHLPWYSLPALLTPSPGILRIISGSPETWDSFAYVAALGGFAWGGFSKAVQSWCDVPVLLPGIIRGSLTRSSATGPPLVLAPREKLDVMKELIQAAAAELGLHKLSVGKRDADVLLGCPDDDELLVYNYEQLERLVVIEADVLLGSTDCKAKIELLAKKCLNSPIGLHFSRRTDAVQEFMRGFRDFGVLSEPGVKMEDVYAFYSLVLDQEEKVARLYDVCKQLLYKRGALHVIVFCNSGSTVADLVAEMKNRGLSAWPLCRGDDVDEDEQLDVDPEMYEDCFSVLITNVYRRTVSGDVINFELPGSVGEYVERVGQDRSTGCELKMVINLVTPDELHRLDHEFAPHLRPMMKLPDDCSRLHQRTRLLFRELVHKA